VDPSERAAPAPPPDDLAAWHQLVLAAKDRLEPLVRHTPTVYSYTYSESCGRDVHLKLENLQRTGAFKLRGALNRLLQCDPAQRPFGLVAASAGNHAQGLALAAKLAGSRATIVMPESTALIKVRRAEGYGAEVILQGRTWDEAHAHALEVAERSGALYVHPFDDPEVIAGQGTVGLEVLEQLPEVRQVIVPAGGGGLLAGIAVAVKGLRPDVRVVGVQAAGADALVQGFESGQWVGLAHPSTIADGIRVGAPGKLTFELIRRYVDDCVRVDEGEIVDAVVQTLQKARVVTEAAGVVGLAALAAGRIPRGDTVCAVLSGGNIDLNLLGRMIEAGLSSVGLYHAVRVRLPDLPGHLGRVLEVVARSRANIMEVEHRRAGGQVPIGYVDVDILLEVRREGQGALIEDALAAEGFDVRPAPRLT
jgi:threonine dehydratase